MNSKNFFFPSLIAAAVIVLNSCGPSQSDLEQLKESMKKSWAKNDSMMNDVNSMIDSLNSTGANEPNSVSFTVDDKAYTCSLPKEGGMYFKSIKGNSQFTFISKDVTSSLGIAITDLAAIKGPREIPLEKGEGKGNLVIYIPKLEAGSEKPPVAYASSTGKINVTEINWKENYISGTFEASDFADSDTEKKVKDFKVIKGTFYKARFTAY